MSSIATVDTTVLLSYALVAVATISWLWGRNKETVPALIGGNGFFSSYAGVYHYIVNGEEVLQDGYRRNPDGVFRIPRLWRWDYLANGTKRIAEIFAAPEDVLSIYHGDQEALQSDYTMGPEITSDPYHNRTVRTKLNPRNIARLLPDVMDEIVSSFEDTLPLGNADWTTFPVMPNIMQSIARITNRIFVGLPLCRNKEYLKVCIDYATAIFKSAGIIAFVPMILRPVIGPFLSPKEKALRHGMKFLGPLVEERLAKEAELGPNWPDKPDDFISWLLEDAQGSARTAPAISLRLLVLNMAALHTSTMALTGALFDLTTHPIHLEPMREEVEHVVKEHGWTKAALDNMHKIDSFLRESQRMNDSITFMRKVVGKDGFAFSDGVVIPYGSFLCTSGRLVHHDSANYDDAEVFNGFRFSRVREEQDPSTNEGIFKRHMVSTGPDHLPFGHGKHACPGRFFATTELKAMFAHLLVSYDIKAENEGVRPADYTFGALRMPSPTARILVRRRQ